MLVKLDVLDVPACRELKVLRVKTESTVQLDDRAAMVCLDSRVRQVLQALQALQVKMAVLDVRVSLDCLDAMG